ncbi:type IX secretion system sortase PorU [Hymenobacter weizhouensis]|uniref:type IX secretion system sortase PorU n=1 Tax=Hymenobacter sp. YIM 151500-1 TaxID=2987689 RepID=UPI002227E6F3|nr:type IX secretion system sortase PorU [Hymenobacter sp. YIM 151500-1]UYZ61719.1 type IX secretion system sortase PorU [Hymenobacter sp. YIM 151500-1]
MRFFTRWVLLCLGWLGCCLPAAAQSAGSPRVVRAQLVWQGVEQVAVQGQKRRVPTFAGALYRPGQPVGTFQLRLPGLVSAGQLTETEYAALTPLEVRQLPVEQLPATPAVRLMSGTENRQPVTLLALEPFRRNPQTGQAEKLVSFAFSYEPAPAEARRGTGTHAYAQASVLRQGDWFKVGVPGSGMYKLDKNLLRTLGLNVQTLDPSRLRLYGNATGTLPQPNRAFRPDDLTENAIQFVGDANATFDDNEYFLFYARGPHTWAREGTTSRFRHQLNPYADTAYYFLTVGTTAGRRVQAAPAVTGAASARISTFAERQFYELDLLNLAKSGRTWVGEEFGNGTQKTVTFSVTDLVPGSSAQLTSSVVASSVQATVFQAMLNGQNLGTQTVPGYSCQGGFGCYPEIANSALSTLSWTVPATPPAELRLQLTYTGGSDPAARGYLDYVELNTRRQLRFSGNSLEFRSLENISSTAVSQFELSNATAATAVWDVTNPRRPAAVALSNGAFLARTDTVREFVAFAPAGSGFLTPRLFGRVANQNLHALNLDGKLDLLIVAHPTFAAQAERLAAHRRTHDGLVAQVVTTTQAYNEFSSGGQDVTAIRDLMRMVYERAPTNKQLYLLLFGDASYDYKSDPANDPAQLPAWWKDRQPANADRIAQNYVPVYESEESFDRILNSRPGGRGITYSSDDYFGLLDEDEGAWLPNTNNELLDVGVGRLPVRTPVGQPRNDDMARLVVDKLIAYDSPTSYGKWRNRLTFVTDDGDGNLFTLSGAEPLANPIDTRQPAYNVHKVYLDMFPQVALAAGQRSPVAERAIDEAIEQGSLLTTYIGHGGPKSWADEQILTEASVRRLQNRNRLTFMFTGTCDFSTYDNPEFTSAGEQALTDTDGGAIGLFTTTRVVYANTNQVLATEFMREVLQRRPNGSLPRLGDVVVASKNAAVAGDNNRNFALLGDPSMRLAYPAQQVVLTELNGQPVSATRPDTLKALQQVTLVGEVQQNGRRLSSFTGTAQVTVFEKKSEVVTLGDDPSDGPQRISVRENALYDGQATVRNGQFRLSFVVPKDINYSVGLGKISLYASDASTRLDAHGAQLVPVGDAAKQARLDTVPPRIRLFMDNESFVFGGLTGTSSTLLARLRDESGINTAGTGIGHDLTATLDNDPSKVVVLNDFYTAEVDSFQAGRVRYLFKDLTPGPHVLRLKAWDTHNNSAERNLEFIAASNEKLALQHVLNYPNPFSRATTFHFDHNRAGEDLEIRVQIFTVSGKLVRTLEATALSSGSHLASLTWDGRDEYQDQLARGVYVYRVSVRSSRDNSTASKFEKLVLIN